MARSLIRTMQGQGPPGGGYPPPNPYGQPNPYDQQGQQPQQPQGYGAPPPQNNYQQGTFDMGGGQQLRVKINGKTPENYLKDRASGMVWGWIIGLGVVAVLVIGGGILGIYVYMKAKSDISDATANSPAGQAAAKAAAWDGKSALTCGGNDHLVVTNVTATAGVTAGGNCHIVMTNVNITAPIAIEAGGNADIVFTGGSLNGSSSAIKAGGNAKVTFAGTKVTGKQDKSGNAKILGI